ncbi:MAG: ribosome small subunit-dependent GTPase A [Myxococcales bacterium]|nr:ribosome small subunit-dependent GTPase A [Myxococcales bacterium]
MARRKKNRPPRKDSSRQAPSRVAHVIEMFGLEALVRPDGEPDDAPLIRALLRKKIARKPGVVVGDRVRIEEVETEGDSPGAVIVAVEERDNVLMRAGWRGHGQAIAANLDAVVVVVSPAQPPLRLGLIDRYLAACQQAGIPAIICLNKAELDVDGEAARELECYAPLDVQIVHTSAAEDDVTQLAEALQRRRAVLVGHSGVGKSSLACALIPGLDREIGAVNETIGRGRHTTTRSSLLAVPGGGELVDTPGIRAFGLFKVEPEELEALYPDFDPFREGCRFRGCTHTHEPGCAVREAADEDKLDAGRFSRYQSLFVSLGEEVDG